MSRSETRKQLRARGLQDTQRSWSNYVGDKPQRSWVGTSNYDESPRYGVRGSDVDRYGGGNRTQRSWDNYVGRDESSPAAEPEMSADTETSQWQQLQDRAKARRENKTPQLSRWEQLQRESALRRGMRSLRGAQSVPSTGPMV